MSITKLFNVFEILMLIKTIIIINCKILNKKPQTLNKTDNEVFNSKYNLWTQQENNSDSSKIHKFLVNAKEKKTFLLDMNNILKFESTKNYFNKRLSKVNEKYSVELFIFLFDNFNKFMLTKKQKNNFYSKNKMVFDLNNKSISKNNTKEKDEKQKISKNQNKNSKLKNNNINKNTKLNAFKKINQTNIKNETEKIKDIYISNIFNNTNENNLKTKNKINSKNENFDFTDFLYKNNLVSSENSIIILISKQNLMIKIFLGQKQLKYFSYNDQRKIAEKFLRNFIEGNTEFGLDELIDNMESLLKTKYPVKLIKLLIIFSIIFSCFANFWIKSRKVFKNNKDPKEVFADNLAIIKKITKNNLSKTDFKEYSDNSCMICLEDILDFDCECHRQQFALKQNKDEIPINEKANEFKIQSENILIENSHYEFSFNKKHSVEVGFDSYQNSDFASEKIKIHKALSFEILTNDRLLNYNNKDSKEKHYAYFDEEITNNKHFDSKALPNLLCAVNSSAFKSKIYNKYSKLAETKCDDFYISKSSSIPKANNKTTKTINESLFFSNHINCSNLNTHKINEDKKPNFSSTNKNNNEKFAAVLDCRHKFHSDCLALWMTKGSFCPVCRTPIEIKSESNSKNIKNDLNIVEHLETDASGDSISILIS